MSASSARATIQPLAPHQPDDAPNSAVSMPRAEEIGITALHMENRLRQLSSQVRQRDGLLNTISAFTRDLLTQPSQPQLVQAVVEKACQLLDTRHAFVDLLSPDGDAMVDHCTFGVFGDTEATRIVKGEGLVGHVWESGQPIMINDFMNWEGRSTQSAEITVRAAIGAPLTFDGKVIGVIGLAHVEPDRVFTIEQLVLLSRFAEIAAAAVRQHQQQQLTRQESDRAVQQVLTREQSLLRVRDTLTTQIADRNARLHRQNAVLSALHETTLSLLGETDSTPLLEGVLAHAKATLNAAYGFVAIVAPDRMTISDVAGDTFAEGMCTPARPGEGLSGQVWSTGRPEVLSDYSTWSQRIDDPALNSLRATMAAPLKSNGEVIGVIGMSHADPNQRFSLDDIEVLSRFAELASLVYDRASLLQSERRNRRVAESLRDVLRVMNSTRSVGEVLDFILQQAVHLLDVQRGILFRLNPHTHELTILAATGVSAPNISQFAIVVPPGTLARARRYLKSGLVLPPSVLNILVAGIRKNIALRDKFGGLADGMGSAITAQLSVDGDTFGGMMLFNPTQRTFSAEDNQVMQSLAMHASLAIENARLRVQAVAAAAEEERSRLARELHDSVSQALFAISLGMNTALQVVDTDPGAVRQPLTYSLALAQAAIAEMRALIFQLRPDLLEQHGLCGVMQTQADALRARNQLTVDLDICPEEPKLPFEIKEAIYRVISEALHNIVKHAHATRVRLVLKCAGDGTDVQIADNGVGFDTSQHFPTSFGLRVMRERMEHLGGIVTISSMPAKGTTVTIHVPAIQESQL